mmetsp:Transcript_88313/g.252980  ORF Transcript_88313/g.252980 Transcript_88313/m.252980 type:complete len:357 (-) Transcript_88313:45-1115(-)
MVQNLPQGLALGAEGYQRLGQPQQLRLLQLRGPLCQLRADDLQQLQPLLQGADGRSRLEELRDRQLRGPARQDLCSLGVDLLSPDAVGLGLGGGEQQHHVHDVARAPSLECQRGRPSQGIQGQLLHQRGFSGGLCQLDQVGGRHFRQAEPRNRWLDPGLQRRSQTLVRRPLHAQHREDVHELGQRQAVKHRRPEGEAGLPKEDLAVDQGRQNLGGNLTLRQHQGLELSPPDRLCEWQRTLSSLASPVQQAQEVPRRLRLVQQRPGKFHQLLHANLPGQRQLQHLVQHLGGQLLAPLGQPLAHEPSQGQHSFLSELGQALIRLLLFVLRLGLLLLLFLLSLLFLFLLGSGVQEVHHL